MPKSPNLFKFSLWFFLCFSILPCIAAEFLTPAENQWLKDNQDKITLEYDALSAPVEFDDQGAYRGIAAEAVAIIESYLDLRFNKRASFDWPRTLKRLESGEAAFNPASAATAERQRYAYFTKAYISVPMVFIGRQNSPDINMDHLQGKKIAVVDQYYSDAVIQAHSDPKTYTLIKVKSVSEGLRKIALGEIDYFFDNLAYCTWYMQKESMSGFKVAGETPYTWDLAFAVSKKYPELYSILNKTLQEIPPAELQKVKSKWTLAQPDSNLPIFISIILVTCIAVVGFLFHRDRYRNFMNRREIELEKRRISQRLAKISAQIPGAMVYQMLQDPQGRREFTFVSDNVESLHGITAEAAIADSSMLYRQLIADDLPKLIECENRALRDLNPFRFEARMLHPELGLRWSLFSSSPEKQLDGSVIWSGIELDITELKNAQLALESEKSEKDQLREQLQQAQKMEAIGRLAGGIAHDFNNALSGIMGVMESFVQASNLTGEQQRTIQLVLSSGERAAQLTKKLLTFARQDLKANTVVDCAKIAHDTISLLQHTLHKNIEIQLDNQAQSCLILGEDSLLHNVLMNMGINAAHAMPSGGTLSYQLQNLLLSEQYCDKSPFDLVPGEYLKVSIIDNGTGIEPEKLSRIFEPFYTTKSTKGTGLGLSMAYSTVKELGGAIEVQSQVGHGTVFHIYLPTTTQDKAAPSKIAPEYSLKGRVLVIDDEELIRMVSEGMLISMGCDVDLACNGVEGIEILRKDPQYYDLIIMDMIMPYMGGKETFSHLREINPKLPIVIASGFAEDNDLDELKAIGAQVFLDKPFRRNELFAVISKILPAKG